MPTAPHPVGSEPTVCPSSVPGLYTRCTHPASTRSLPRRVPPRTLQHTPRTYCGQPPPPKAGPCSVLLTSLSPATQIQAAPRFSTFVALMGGLDERDPSIPFPLPHPSSPSLRHTLFVPSCRCSQKKKLSSRHGASRLSLPPSPSLPVCACVF